MTWRKALDRLGTGERCWAAEFAVRAAGAALLAVCTFALLWLYRSVHQPPHQTSALELVAATAAVVAGSGGGLLTFAGPALFKQVPPPVGPSRSCRLEPAEMNDPLVRALGNCGHLPASLEQRRR